MSSMTSNHLRKPMVKISSLAFQCQHSYQSCVKFIGSRDDLLSDLNLGN